MNELDTLVFSAFSTDFHGSREYTLDEIHQMVKHYCNETTTYELIELEKSMDRLMFFPVTIPCEKTWSFSSNAIGATKITRITGSQKTIKYKVHGVATPQRAAKSVALVKTFFLDNPEEL